MPYYYQTYITPNQRRNIELIFDTPNIDVNDLLVLADILDEGGVWSTADYIRRGTSDILKYNLVPHIRNLVYETLNSGRASSDLPQRLPNQSRNSRRIVNRHIAELMRTSDQLYWQGLQQQNPPLGQGMTSGEAGIPVNPGVGTPFERRFVSSGLGQQLNTPIGPNLFERQQSEFRQRLLNLNQDLGEGLGIQTPRRTPGQFQYLNPIGQQFGIQYPGGSPPPSREGWELPDENISSGRQTQLGQRGVQTQLIEQQSPSAMPPRPQDVQGLLIAEYRHGQDLTYYRQGGTRYFMQMPQSQGTLYRTNAPFYLPLQQGSTTVHPEEILARDRAAQVFQRTLSNYTRDLGEGFGFPLSNQELIELDRAGVISARTAEVRAEFGPFEPWPIEFPETPYRFMTQGSPPGDIVTNPITRQEAEQVMLGRVPGSGYTGFVQTSRTATPERLADIREAIQRYGLEQVQLMASTPGYQPVIPNQGQMSPGLPATTRILPAETIATPVVQNPATRRAYTSPNFTIGPRILSSDEAAQIRLNPNFYTPPRWFGQGTASRGYIQGALPVGLPLIAEGLANTDVGQSFVGMILQTFADVNDILPSWMQSSNTVRSTRETVEARNYQRQQELINERYWLESARQQQRNTESLSEAERIWRQNQEILMQQQIRDSQPGLGKDEGILPQGSWWIDSFSRSTDVDNPLLQARPFRQTDNNLETDMSQQPQLPPGFIQGGYRPPVIETTPYNPYEQMERAYNPGYDDPPPGLMPPPPPIVVTPPEFPRSGGAFPSIPMRDSGFPLADPNPRNPLRRNEMPLQPRDRNIPAREVILSALFSNGQIYMSPDGYRLSENDIPVDSLGNNTLWNLLP